MSSNGVKVFCYECGQEKECRLVRHEEGPNNFVYICFDCKPAPPQR